jgi:hypothetical protein
LLTTSATMNLSAGGTSPGSLMAASRSSRKARNTRGLRALAYQLFGKLPRCFLDF